MNKYYLNNGISRSDENNRDDDIDGIGKILKIIMILMTDRIIMIMINNRDNVYWIR